MQGKSDANNDWSMEGGRRPDGEDDEIFKEV